MSDVIGGEIARVVFWVFFVASYVFHSEQEITMSSNAPRGDC